MVQAIPSEDLYLFRETARELVAYFAELHTALEQFDLKMIPFLQKRMREVHLPRLRGVEARLELHARGNEAAADWLKHAKNLAGGCQLLSGPINPANPASLLSGFHSAGDVLVGLFPYRLQVPELERFFLETDPPDGFREPAPRAEIGRIPFGSGGQGTSHALMFRPAGRGNGLQRPLVVLLHGAFGAPAEFISLWLRTLHTRCWYALVPKSRGTTWDPKEDFPAIAENVSRLIREEAIDPAQVLVAGLSDGGSAALELGISRGDLFTGACCVSGVLKPWVAVENARKKIPVHLIHGTADFLFPVQTARMAETRLKNAGFPVTYREVQGLSHTYPVSKNPEIAAWFEKS